MPEEIIHETDLTGALEGIERATRSDCAMCDLHWHREQDQRGVIHALERELQRRHEIAERFKRQRNALLWLGGTIAVLTLWRWLP